VSYIIRKGKKEDAPQVFQLIEELAAFERAPHEVENTSAQFADDVFGHQPIADFLVAVSDHDQQIVGASIYFTSYSTWKGRCLYLEDLIVTESHRGNGLGQKLLEETARIANEQGAKRMAWQVLDWNEPAIAFYKKMGAELAPEWVNCKLEGEALQSRGRPVGDAPSGENVQ